MYASAALAAVEGSPRLEGAAEPDVEIVVPVYNERATLERSIARLQAYLVSSFPWSFRLTIADNGSTDGTWALAQRLASRWSAVRAVRLEAKGRGRALDAVWSESGAKVLAYMDVDLSTDLSALLPLVAPILSGHSEVAIGTRLARGARVVRGPKRELISRCYNAVLHLVLGARFSDAQCGFKAIRSDCARELLPEISDRGWFFDTELLVRAERAGLRIYEVPVDWVDDPDSRVEIVATALADLRGVVRLLRELGRGGRSAPRAAEHRFRAQVAWFAAIGVCSSIAYALLFLALRGSLGSQAGNALALGLTAVANTAANRRLTFSVRGRERMLAHQLQGLAVFGLALAATAGSIALLQLASPRASRAFELSVLLGANLAATVVRFVGLRSWVFRAQRASPLHEAHERGIA